MHANQRKSEAQMTSIGVHVPWIDSVHLGFNSDDLHWRVLAFICG
jgi:hypothetical protein